MDDQDLRVGEEDVNGLSAQDCMISDSNPALLTDTFDAPQTNLCIISKTFAARRH